jgi:isopropylmalate/homocitrate/citramalate synthase
MKIERVTGETGGIKHRVYLKAEEITETETEGVYTLNDEDAAASLGEASIIIVIDTPGMTLYWDIADQVARLWTVGPYTMLDVSEIGM